MTDTLLGAIFGVLATSALLLTVPRPDSALAGAAPAVAGSTAPTDCADAQAMTARLQREVDDARQLVLAAELMAAIGRGQVVAVEGIAQQWPPDAPEIVRPDRFRAELERRLAEHGEFDIEEVDCSEFPCAAVVRVHADGVQGMRYNRAAYDLAKAAWPDRWAVENSTEFTAGAGTTLMVLAPYPKGNDELAKRTEHRVRQLARDNE